MSENKTPETTGKEIVIRNAQELARIDVQLDLITTKFKLEPSAAERYKVVKDGKYFKLVKRETPIKIIAGADGNPTVSAMVAVATYGERLFKKTKGRYNDEHRLIESQSASIETKEVMSMVRPF